MKCEAARRSLILGQGSASVSSARARRHFERCASCSQERAKILAILGAISEAAVPDPGEAYWEAFLPNVRRRIARAGAGAAPVSWDLARRRALPLAAAVALLVVALVAIRLMGPAPAVSPPPGTAPLKAELDALLNQAPATAGLQAIADLSAGDPGEPEEGSDEYPPASTAVLLLDDASAASALRDVTALTTPSDAGGWAEFDDITDTLTAAEAEELIRSLAPDDRSSTATEAQEVLG